MNKFVVILILFSSIALFSKNTSKPEIQNTLNYQNIQLETEVTNKIDTIFTSQPIPDNIYEKMLGNSIPLKYKNKINKNTLSYLQITYIGFDDVYHTGELVVNAKLADEVLDIFKELYEIKYPIEKIKLIDEYNANDELSMSDNNTSCFCYRVIAGTSSVSNHATRNSNRYKPTI